MSDKYIEELPELTFEPKVATARLLIPLLDALGWKGEQSRLVEALPENPNYLDINGVKETLANLNFKTHHLKNTGVDKIDKRIVPCILINKDKSYLIIRNDSNRCLIYDGDDGKYLYADNKDLQGDVYIFKFVSDSRDSILGPKKEWFTKLIKRFMPAFVPVLLLTLLITLMDLATPLFIMLFYDNILKTGSHSILVLLGSGVIIFLLSGFALKELKMNLMNFLSIRIGNIVTNESFYRLMYLSPAYTETASINSQIARIKDFESIKEIFINGTLNAFFELIFLFIYIIAIIYLGGIIGVVPIVVLFVLLPVGFILRPFNKIHIENSTDLLYAKQQNTVDILNNLREIRVTGTKDAWIERNDKATGEYIMANLKTAAFSNTVNHITFFLTTLSGIIVVYMAVMAVISGKLSSGALIAVFMLFWRTVYPVRNVFSSIIQIFGIQKSVGQINRFMMLPQDNSPDSGMISVADVKGEVDFIDVSLKYTKESHAVLLNFNLKVDPGKIVAITGHDGAGKTSILKLILGMYKPQAGRILIDNTNLNQFEPISLRRSISYSQERSGVLSGTIIEHFKHFNHNLNIENILKIADLTGLKPFLDYLPSGLTHYIDKAELRTYDSEFIKLLNITGTFYKKSGLYLFDEPENELCKENILKVSSALKELRKKAGVIVVTKSDDFLAVADKVVYIDKGRVKFEGSAEKYFKTYGRGG